MSEGAVSPGVEPLALAGRRPTMLMSVKDAALFLGVSPETLEEWRAEGLISRRKPREGDKKAMWYTLPDLLAFVEGMPKG